MRRRRRRRRPPSSTATTVRAATHLSHASCARFRPQLRDGPALIGGSKRGAESECGWQIWAPVPSFSVARGQVADGRRVLSSSSSSSCRDASCRALPATAATTNLSPSGRRVLRSAGWLARARAGRGHNGAKRSRSWPSRLKIAKLVRGAADRRRPFALGARPQIESALALRRRLERARRFGRHCRRRRRGRRRLSEGQPRRLVRAHRGARAHSSRESRLVTRNSQLARHGPRKPQTVMKKSRRGR